MAEKEYIEREALIEKLETLLSDLRFIVKYEKQHGSVSDVEKSKAKFETMKGVISLVKSQPTADVQEVVRCKDCRWRGTEECSMYYRCNCGEQHTWETDNDFCSWGERLDKE